MAWFSKQQQQAAVEYVILDLLPTTCAWCNAKKGLPQGNGSHGMCEDCQQEELEKYQAAKASKKERV